MRTVLFAAPSETWEEYRTHLPDAVAEAGVAARIVTGAPPGEVDYIVYAPSGGLRDFGPFDRLRTVFCLWAGVETVVGNDTLTVPLTRMVDPGLTAGMVEYCLGHVLRHHLGIDADILRAPGDWTPRTPPLAQERKVAVLGLGALGGAVASALASAGFRVAGWSRREKKVTGIDCHFGEDGLARALDDADAVILLLPDTPETENILDADAIRRLAPGAAVINPGRGPLVDDAALLAALDEGRLGHATLDVFRHEPLPVDHPFWTHPRVTVTPHIAAATRAVTASRVIAENLRRAEAGEPLLHLVDRAAGY